MNKIQVINRENLLLDCTEALISMGGYNKEKATRLAKLNLDYLEEDMLETLDGRLQYIIDKEHYRKGVK